MISNREVLGERSLDETRRPRAPRRTIRTQPDRRPPSTGSSRAPAGSIGLTVMGRAPRGRGGLEPLNA